MVTLRETLKAEALEALRREVPEELEWLPRGDLPSLRWSDGSSVDPAIPKGWLVTAALCGDAEPDASLRRRATLFHPGDAAALGRWLLGRWIAHDTQAPELTAARRDELREIAERAADMARRFGRGGTDADERFRQLLEQEQNRAEPTAMPHQGLLAIVAVCADATAAPDIESYLATWSGKRSDQCRALRQVLTDLTGRAVS